MRNIGIFVLTLFCGGSCGEPYCKENITVLSSLDEESPDGISATQILERVVGNYLTQMEYHEQMMGRVFVDVKPPARITDLELDVQYNGGEIRFVESKLVDPPGSGGNSIETECLGGGTEVDVVLVVRSQDGLLNEVLDTKLFVSTHAGNPGENMKISLLAPLDPDNMVGTAKFNDIRPPNPRMKSLDVSIFCAFGGDEAGMRSCRWGGTILYGGGGTNFQIASCWPK